jgi:hypothetical protein
MKGSRKKTAKTLEKQGLLHPKPHEFRDSEK